MIQRIQTIWLLLAAICVFLTIQFPLYSGTTANNVFVELNGQYNLLLLIITVAVGILSAVTIFLFKNRKLQVRLAIVALIVQIGALALYISQLKNFTSGNFALGSVLSFAVIIFLIMAIVAINKDQKLVKSLDRLR